MKSFFRYLGRNRLYTVVNIFGFAVSLMFAILIGDYTWRQLSMDSWHKNSDRVYLLADDDSFKSWPDITKGMEQTFPEIEKTCIVQSQNGKVISDFGEYDKQTKQFMLLADPDFFDFFDFKLLEGDSKTALDSPEKVVLTRTLADVLFPEGAPIGKPVRIAGTHNLSFGEDDPLDTTLVYTVSGIIEDLYRTVLPTEVSLIASSARFPQIMGYTLSPDVNGRGPGGYCKSYIMTYKGTDIETLEEKLTRYAADKVPYYSDRKQDLHMHLIPQSKIAFATQNDGITTAKGDYGRIMILLAAVIALLFFAISNYINLTVAGAVARVKEMATRRILGSTRREIMLKFIFESTFIVCISFIMGFLLALAFEDKVSILFSGQIELIRDINPTTIAICTAFILFTGCIAGIIPSVQVSRFSSIDVTKGTYRRYSKTTLSKAFIILQNTITVVLIVAAMVIWLQIRHMISAPLGFETQNRYYVYSGGDNSDVIRNKLEELPGVTKVGFSAGTDLFGYGSSWTTRKLPDGRGIDIYNFLLDSSAVSILGIKTVGDIDIHDESVYVTEKLLKIAGLESNANEIEWANGKVSQISGVLQDFHLTNILSEPLPFMVGVYAPEEIPFATLIVQTDGAKETISAIEDFLKREYADGDGNGVRYNITSFEEMVDNSFIEDRRTLKIVEMFALVAVIISALGFIGMSLFFIRQRRKEIGIRKIVGGNSTEVGALMMKIFCSPLLFSFLIAIPISWFIMSNWLNGFSYKIELYWWIFASACAASLFIAVLSVISQIIYAVKQNPVDSIKID